MVYNPTTNPVGKVLGAATIGTSGMALLPQTSRLPIFGSVSLAAIALFLLAVLTLWGTLYFLVEKVRTHNAKKN